MKFRRNRSSENYVEVKKYPFVLFDLAKIRRATQTTGAVGFVHNKKIMFDALTEQIDSIESVKSIREWRNAKVV